MEGSELKQFLIPEINLNEVSEYAVYKDERLIVRGKDKNPFERKYLFEIRKVQENLFEVYYPNSVLQGMRFLNSLSSYYEDMLDPSSQTIYISTNESYNLLIENKNELKTSVKKIKDKLELKIKDEEQRSEIVFKLDQIISDEKIDQSFFEDLNYLFYYSGTEKRDNEYILYNEDETRLERFLSKATQNKSYLNMIH